MSFMGIIIGLIVLLFSAILHEVAHGYVADRLGDPTARLMGRLTLNPIKHIDPIMSLVLPLLLILSGSPVIFGGAKPVPVDPYNLKEGRKDVALVSLAGPMTNILIAIIFALLLKLSFFSSYDGIALFLSYLFHTIVSINLFLAIFNLLPIPPLDGSKLFALLLPEREAAMYLSLGSIGMIIIFVLLAYPIGGFSLSTFMESIYLYAIHLLGV